MWFVWYLLGVVSGVMGLFLYAAMVISGEESRKKEAPDAKSESEV